MRARNIKPGFFKNEDLAEVSFEARILFLGLACMADREGRLEDRPKKIKMEVFPADSVDVNALLEELMAVNQQDPLIVRYKVDGGSYIYLPKFKKHQRIHQNESESCIPIPPQERAKEESACNHGDKSGEPNVQALRSESLKAESLKSESLTSESL